MLHNEKGTTRKNKPENKNNTAHENSANKTKQNKNNLPPRTPSEKKMIMSTFPLYATCPLLVCQGQQNVKNSGGFGVCPTIQA
jgi:predicted nucleotidyltransferase